VELGTYDQKMVLEMIPMGHARQWDIAVT